MTAATERNFKFAVVTLLAAISGFWFNMEDYQKDRFATLVVRSVVGIVDQSTAPQPTEALETPHSRLN